jgi:ABC-type multidrug transport system fused ATPase/permease subunit
MNEKEIMLLEKYLDDSASSEEKQQFENLLKINSELRAEYEEQKRVKEVLNTMKLKNPAVEVWDSYWLNIYNKVERGLAWIAISIGLLIVFAYAAIQFVNQFYVEGDAPLIVKIGTTVLVFGVLILFYSILREKLFTYKHDKYKEIQR